VGVGVIGEKLGDEVGIDVVGADVVGADVDGANVGLSVAGGTGAILYLPEYVVPDTYVAEHPTAVIVTCSISSVLPDLIRLYFEEFVALSEQPVTELLEQ